MHPLPLSLLLLLDSEKAFWVGLVFSLLLPLSTAVGVPEAPPSLLSRLSPGHQGEKSFTSFATVVPFFLLSEAGPKVRFLFRRRSSFLEARS